MRGLKSKLGRLAGAFLGFFGIMAFTACYGAPANYYSGASGTVRGDIDGDGANEPVPGIQVSLKNSSGGVVDSGKTNGQGKFFLEKEGRLSGRCVLEFRDVDGELNGSFKAKDEVLEFSGIDDEFLARDVVLERGE